MIDDKHELLRRWLRGRGHDAQSIATAITWKEQEVSAGRTPTDDAVLKIAEGCHHGAVQSFIQGTPQHQSIVIEHKLEWALAAGASFGGGLVGVLVGELLRHLF